MKHSCTATHRDQHEQGACGLCRVLCVSAESAKKRHASAAAQQAVEQLELWLGSCGCVVAVPGVLPCNRSLGRVSAPSRL